MQYLNLQAEADLINRHFINHSLVTVTASGLWDTDQGDPKAQITVDIVAPRARGTIEAERERESAMFAALAELEALPIVKSVYRIGWVDSDDGLGDCFLVTLA